MVITGILGRILGDDIGLIGILSSASPSPGARKTGLSLFSLALQLLIDATSRVSVRRGTAVARSCFVVRKEAFTLGGACEGALAILVLLVASKIDCGMLILC